MCPAIAEFTRTNELTIRQPMILRILPSLSVVKVTRVIRCIPVNKSQVLVRQKHKYRAECDIYVFYLLSLRFFLLFLDNFDDDVTGKIYDLLQISQSNIE